MDIDAPPPGWFENRYDGINFYRQFSGFHDRITTTEHHRLKALLEAIQVRLEEVEEQLHFLEESKLEQRGYSGSQENIDITSSFETLFFWMRMLEKKLLAYSKKVFVETEFGPRVKIIRRKIHIFVKKAGDWQ